ncbi:unnamed protein product, partial [marine sediment metagenome]
ALGESVVRPGTLISGYARTAVTPLVDCHPGTTAPSAE